MGLVDGTQGTVLWSFNHLRTTMLTSLLNDLTALEAAGFGSNHGICPAIQAALDFMINAATAIPRGGFLTGSLYTEIEKFKEVYVEWNDVEGATAEAVDKRRERLKDLRKSRQKISNRVRKLQYELENNLDQLMVHSIYKAMSAVIEMVPGIFANLAFSYDVYLKRGGLP